MSGRKVSKKKRPNTRASEKPASGSEVRVETTQLNPGAEASQLPSPGLPRRPTTLNIFKGDLSVEAAEFLSKQWVLSIDTETGGLDPRKNKLLLVQICTQQGQVFMIRNPSCERSVNLMLLLAQQHLTWIFHHAMFDLRFLKAGLGITPLGGIECTKTLMKVLHPELPCGLGNALKNILGITINKGIKHSWDKEELNERDVEYASNDVLYLHELLSELRLHAKIGEINTYQRAMNAIDCIAGLEIEGYTDLFVYEQEPLEKRQEQRAFWQERQRNALFGLLEKEEMRNE